jgi:excinuclease ABC subunit A
MIAGEVLRPAAVSARRGVGLPDAGPPVADPVGRRGAAGGPGLLPGRLAGATPSTFWTSPPSGCTPATTAAWSGSWSTCGTRPTRWWWSSTTRRSSARADYLLDIGPQAGDRGGEIVYFGPTGRRARLPHRGVPHRGARIPLPARRRRPRPDRWLTVVGAAEHNLKDLDVAIPLGLLVCLTGVSGSGKSTLAEEILFKGIKWARNDSQGRPGRHRGIDRRGEARRGGPGGSARHRPHPAGQRPDLHQGHGPHPQAVLAETPGAGGRLRPGALLLQRGPGRCETCRGEGFERVEMQFLSDVTITCPDCGGKRFTPEVLSPFPRPQYRRYPEYDRGRGPGVFQRSDRGGPPLSPWRRSGWAISAWGSRSTPSPAGGPAAQAGAPPGGRPRPAEPLDLRRAHHRAAFRRYRAPAPGPQRLVSQGHSVLVVEHNLDVVKSRRLGHRPRPRGRGCGRRLVAPGRPRPWPLNPGRTPAVF